MNPLLIVGLFVTSTIVILVIVRVWLNQLEERSKPSTELIEWMKDLGGRVETSTSKVDERLIKNMEMFNTRLDNAARIIGNVQKSIGEFSEIGRSMQELQEFLNSPKMRGNIGEQILKDLLAQYFPRQNYKLQYPFKSGEKVDAVILTSQGMIPIDSKFPSENFRKYQQAKTELDKNNTKKEFTRDVKKHIDDISKKYILVNENTVDYALMYVPSEAVYYEIINQPDLYEYSTQMRVLPVSPLSFYAYMKSILMSFEGQRIEQQAKEILTMIRAIQKDYEKTEEAMSVLNKHLTNAYNQLTNVSKYFGSLGQKISSTRLLSSTKQLKIEDEN